MKFYTVLSPFAFSLQGFILFSTLCNSVGSISQQANIYNPWIFTCLCIHSCRHAEQGNVHAGGIGNVLDPLFQCQTSSEILHRSKFAIMSPCGLIPLCCWHGADPKSQQPGFTLHPLYTTTESSKCTESSESVLKGTI